MGRVVATSWQLTQHLTDELRAHPSGVRIGRAVCGAGPVYDDAALRRYHFTDEALARPRPMCKRCARTAACPDPETGARP